jgi:hypothetical protein
MSSIPVGNQVLRCPRCLTVAWNDGETFMTTTHDGKDTGFRIAEAHCTACGAHIKITYTTRKDFLP